MLKVYFEYGTMGSSKSASLLMIAKNYNLKGVETILVKPKLDIRQDGIKSRVGLESDVDVTVDTSKGLDDNIDLIASLDDAINNDKVILIDEAQFFNYELVRELYSFCMFRSKDKDTHNFCIMAFGLLTDLHAKLFEGSKAWVEISDSLREIKNICHYCSAKATKNLYIGDKNLKEGENIIVGNEFYPVCSEHYWEGI